MKKHIKLLIKLVSLILLMLLTAGSVFADETEENSDTVEGALPITQAEYSKDQVVPADLLGILHPEVTETQLEDGTFLYGYYGDFNVTASPAIVMDIDSGQVIFGKNIYDAHYPASITKIMTALCAVQNADPQQPVTISEEDVYSIEFGSANAGMLIGETIPLDVCLRCMMAQSANDCAYAAGRTVAGSMEAFVDLMNETAEKLKCVNSHFANPHGLHDENHYVCAYDMALIASAAYQNSWFRSFCFLETYNRPITEMNPEDNWAMYNRHRMFHPDNAYYYEYITGGKTGYTDQAQSTLVTFAEKGGRRLVAVVLNCKGEEVYTATRAMFDYAFDNFTNLKASDMVDHNVIEKLDRELIITLPDGISGNDVDQELTVGNDLEANIVFSYNGKKLCESACTITRDYRDYLDKKQADIKAAQEENTASAPTDDFTPKKEIHINYELILIIVIIVAVILIVILLIKRKYDKKRKEYLEARRKKDSEWEDSSGGETLFGNRFNEEDMK